ncbi:MULTISPECIES: hypothetical protein [unclassified Tenacibaculum]|uniref:hypothetical protein n=1 Tax=unclassified Tenacibaculum TaxID=2635139 RepID=UPI001F15DBC8|nr:MULTISPECIES: hypothetical protein [unclassified Tenacibaculum]MCF2873489.1 hypothetical protein [Tenacibaculum sp. Cn5-1]MCF2933645.1 hypothetical protein [Tenacibaculum sp. Cn5-34]MCG7509773.1 hypothetical protein [Tenacibaculum sp. Cn5-46]
MRYILLSLLLISNITFSQDKNKTDSNPWVLKQLLSQALSDQKEGKHERAIKDFSIALKIPDLKNIYTEEYANFLEGYAVSSLALGKTKGLLKKYEEVLRVREKLNNARGLSSIHLNISDYYQKTNNYSLADKHAKKAFDYAVDLEDNSIKFKIIEKVLNLNSNKESKEYLKKYINLKDELVEEKVEITNKADRYNHLSTKKDKEISLLKTEKLNLQNEVSSQENISLKLGFLSLFILIVGIICLIIQQRKKNNLVLANNEKTKLSHELHNTLSNKLFKARESLSSMHVYVETKELNKYSFYIRELENIEKEIGEASTKIK